MNLLRFLIIVLIISFSKDSLAQSKAITFEKAASKGLSYQHLDSLYKSAIHSDSKLGVFKSAAEQATLQQAYVKLINELGIFLKSNKFKWGKQTRCFNRIYFNPQGGIDYFLFNFPKDELSAEKEKEFEGLLSKFIKNHKISLTAKENFAQCSPIKYNDI